MKTNYIVSHVKTYDGDQELYYTYVGLDNKNKDLLYSVWGKTAEESRGRAEELVRKLEAAIYIDYIFGTKINLVLRVRYVTFAL